VIQFKGRFSGSQNEPPSSPERRLQPSIGSIYNPSNMGRQPKKQRAVEQPAGEARVRQNAPRQASDQSAGAPSLSQASVEGTFGAA